MQRGDRWAWPGGRGPVRVLHEQCGHDVRVEVRCPHCEREAATAELRARARGDLVRFAPGPDGAHKATNRGGQTARIVMFSSAHEPAVAVYPDSDKIGVWPGNDADRVMLRRVDGRVDYFDGER